MTSTGHRGKVNTNGARSSRSGRVGGFRVLVTGGAGYIGSHLVRKLLARGYRVRILDSLLYGDGGVRELADAGDLELVEGDIRDIDHVIRALTGAVAVIDLAAIVGDPACELDADGTYGSNYEATKVLLDLCQLKGISRLVFASSCSVYGSNPHMTLNEGSWVNPVSLYARTRLMSEEAILANHGGIDPVILRLGTVFGMSYRPRFDLVVNMMAAKATVEHRIQVHGGDQWRPNVHVQDAADAFILAMEAPRQRTARQVFNVGSDDLNLTIGGLARVVASVVSGTEIEIMGDAPDRRDYRVSFEKIRQLLGFRPSFKIEDGVREIRGAIEAGQIGDFYESVYHNVAHLKARGEKAALAAGRRSAEHAAAFSAAPERAADADGQRTAKLPPEPAVAVAKGDPAAASSSLQPSRLADRADVIGAPLTGSSGNLLGVSGQQDSKTTGGASWDPAVSAERTRWS